MDIIKIEELTPYSRNAKKHNQKQIKQVAESIKRFGFVQPIVIDKNNEVVIGHARLEASKLLNLKEVPVISVEKLTDKEVKALRLADNKLNESDWDMDLVIEDLKELDDEMFNLTGFDTDLLIEPDEKDDLIPENPPAIAKVGDVWQLGRHRVMCGDSTKREDVEKLMDGKKADIVFTDPPYGMDLDTEFLHIHKNHNHGTYGSFGKQHRKVIGDDKIFNPSFIFELFDYCKEIFLWGADYYSEYLPLYGGWFVWDKAEGDFKGRIGNEFELCWSKQRHKRTIIHKRWVGHIGLETQDKNERFHPTQKPIEVISPFIKNFIETGSIVLDLFLGSGSTLIACEKTNRICYGMELDPKYCDIIIKRYEDYSGNKAIKL